jgi:hypothetical protein
MTTIERDDLKTYAPVYPDGLSCGHGTAGPCLFCDTADAVIAPIRDEPARLRRPRRRLRRADAALLVVAAFLSVVVMTGIASMASPTARHLLHRLPGSSQFFGPWHWLNHGGRDLTSGTRPRLGPADIGVLPASSPAPAPSQAPGRSPAAQAPSRLSPAAKPPAASPAAPAPAPAPSSSSPAPVATTPAPVPTTPEPAPTSAAPPPTAPAPAPTDTSPAPAPTTA